MKKGLPRIIIGCILIFFQLLSVIGNSLTGNHLSLSFTNLYVLIYDLIGLLTYYFIGILGVILLVSGIIAYNRKERFPKGNKTKEQRSHSLDSFDSTTEDLDQIPTVSTEDPGTVHMSKPQIKETRTASKPNTYKYCSHCGSPINHTTKKCTGCGKQFFSIVRFRKFILCAVCILLCFLLLFSVKNNISMQQILKEKDDLITQLINEKESLLSQYEEEIEKLELEVRTQHAKGYSAGKEIGYEDGYRKGQLDGLTEKQQKAQSKYEEHLEKLDETYGSNSN